MAGKRREQRSGPSDGPVPAGAPKWVSRELIERTLRVWQPYYRAALTTQDALDMLLAVSRLFGVLSREPSA
jgi:hypothetical protein